MNPPPTDPLLGRTLGPYTLRRLIGEGETGAVYEAEQSEPHRTAAVKVLRGAADAERVRTFEHEIDVLARVRHPGIAAIYSAGTTPDGRPYFAMEFAPGDTLDAHMRAHHAGVARTRSAVAARLRVFLRVCDAIASAHQRGVIHGDLSPDNIRVSDDGASVKIVDFGVARRVDGEDRDGRVRGTLAYMSPEHASPEAADIDARSDVYSLGVLLYEMLTGAAPYDIVPGSVAASLRVIADTPARSPRIGSDVNTIVLTALRKDPALRYQSAALLADDIRRFLAGHPIHARPASTLYQLRLLAGRHPVAAALAGLVTLSLIGGIIGTSVALLRARRAEARARVEAARAHAQTETAEQVTSFLEEAFRIADPGEARGNSVTAREILDRSAARIDSMLTSQPSVRAHLLLALGTVYKNLGVYAAARPFVEQSLALRRAQRPMDSLAVARAEYVLGALLRESGDYRGARTHYETALAIRQRARGTPVADLIRSMNGVGNAYGMTDPQRSLILFEKCYAMERARAHPDTMALADYLTNLSAAQWQLGRYASALRGFQEAAALVTRKAGPTHPRVLTSRNALAGVLDHLGRYAEASREFARVVPLQASVLGPDHPDRVWTFLDWSHVLGCMGEYERALWCVAQARAVHGRQREPNKTMTRTIDELYANCLLATGDAAGARGAARRLLGDETASVNSAGRAIRPLITAGEAEYALGHATAARAYFDRARAAIPAGKPLQTALSVGYARLERDQSRWPAALEQYRAALRTEGADRSIWPLERAAIYEEYALALRKTGASMDSASAYETRARTLREHAAAERAKERAVSTGRTHSSTRMRLVLVATCVLSFSNAIAAC